jgi:hypothetical protein
MAAFGSLPKDQYMDMAMELAERFGAILGIMILRVCYGAEAQGVHYTTLT